MPQETKTETIEKLKQGLLELKEKRRTNETNIDELASQRDELNEKTSKIRDEVDELRAERDRLNGKVKEEKQQRNDLNTVIHEKIDQAKKLDQEIETLAQKKPTRNHQSLQKEIDEIDWKIQTSSIPLTEERELVGQVARLETQLSTHKKREQKTQAKHALQNEIEILKNKSQQLHKSLTELAQKSQEIHKVMLEKSDILRRNKTDADDKHRQYVEAKTKLKPLDDEIAAIAIQIRHLKEEFRVEEQTTKKQAEKQLREDLQRKVKEKMNRGEKLNWQEFQLLEEESTSEDQ